MADNSTNAKVIFKRGAQENLNKFLLQINEQGQIVGDQAIDGAFYLTSDTNRLYVGKRIDQNNVKAVPVNQGVINVSEIAALPEKNKVESGQFYYAEKENVLCIYSGDHGWVQINPDTYVSITERVATGTKNNEIYEFTDIISQAPSNSPENRSIFSSKFGIDGSKGINISLSEYEDSDGKKIPKFTISQNNSILSSTLTEEDDSRILSLKLDDGADSVSSVNICVKDESNIIIEKENDNITLDSYDTTVEEVGLSFNENGQLQTVVKTNGKTEKYITSNSVTPTIKYGVTQNGNNIAHPDSAVFKNGQLELDVYSRQDIDKKFIGINPMVYKGLMHKTPEDTGLISIGDTYKSTSYFTVNTVDSDNESVSFEVKPGDLLIANIKKDASENDNGYIPVGSLRWDYIPSGDDSLTDTQYGLAFNRDGKVSVDLIENINSVNPVGVGKIVFSTEENELLNITQTIDIDNGKNDTEIKINHKTNFDNDGNKSGEVSNNKGIEQSSGSTLEFNIPVLEYDRAGHITKVENQKYTAIDSRYELKGIGVSEDGVTTDSATVSVTLLNATSTGTSTKDFDIKSSTLNMYAEKDGNGATGNLIMDLEWGSF